MLSAYRREFTDFMITLRSDQYRYFAGLQKEPRTADIFDRYSDLITLDAIARLKKEREEISEHFETAGRGLDHLIAFACQYYLKKNLANITGEIEHYLNRAQIEHNGENAPFHQLNHLLAIESSRPVRRDLYKKYLQIIAPINDLRGERLEKLREQVTKLGYQSYQQMQSEQARIDLSAIDAQMQRFLAETEKIYNVNQARVLAGLQIPRDEASRSDSFYFTRPQGFDELFPARLLRSAYQETMENLGIRTGKQNNIMLEFNRPMRSYLRAFSIPIRVPLEIRIVMRLSGGLTDYELFFHEAGCAQHAAYTADDLRPELKYAGDRALTHAYGLLFRNIINDPHWLEAIFDAREAGEMKMITTLLRLYQIRRYAAQLHYEIDLYRGNFSPDLYLENLDQATGFHHDRAEYLSDVTDSFQSANYLRAWIFEVMLREYLKTRYGYSWWRNRKAGDLLKELWHTGYRYSIEDLCDQLGLGPLIIEPLEMDFLINLPA